MVVTAPWFYWWCQFGVYSGFVTATFSSAAIERSWRECVAASGFSACAGELLMVIEYCSLVSALISVSDVLIHSAAASVQSSYWRSSWARFDAAVVGLNFVATFLLCCGGTAWGGFGTVLKLSRPLRVLRFASLTRTIQKFFKLVTPIVNLVMKFGLVYWLITYSFAVVGFEVFATDGVANDTTQQVRRFDTFPYALMALFQITISNNWNDIL